jgi:hypothetical protein
MNPGSRQGAGPGRPLIADLAWAVCLTAAVMALLLAAGGVWERQHFDDLHGQFLAKYEYAATSLFRHGRLPLWNPWEFCGSTLLASPQNLALYPPALVLFAALPLRAALQGLYAFHVLVLSWSALAYLRWHGVARGAASAVPFIVLAQMFVGPAHMGVDHPNFLGTICWLPLVLLGVERAIAGRPVWLAAGALASAAQWLAGAPELGLDGGVLVMLVAVVAGSASLSRRLAAGAAVLGLGVVLAAVQLVPLAEAVASSARGVEAVGYAAARRVFRYGYLLSVTKPASVALALAIIPFSLWGLSGESGLSSRVRGRLAWLAAWAWCLFALFPPLDLVYRLPGFSGVRLPTGWQFLGPVFLAFLVAAAADAAWRRRTPMGWLVVGLTVAAVAQSAGIVQRMPGRLRHPAPDYGLIARRAEVLRATMDALPVPARIVSSTEVLSGATLRYGIPSAAGFDPTMPPVRVLRLAEAVGLEQSVRYRRGKDLRGIVSSPDVAARLGIGILVVPAGMTASATALRGAGFQAVASLPGGDVAWYRPPLPRARLVHEARVAATDEEAFAAAVASAGDAHRIAVITGDALPDLALPPEGAVEAVRITRDEAEQLVIEVEAAAPGLLVLADTFFPGWTATVDGTPVEILLADHAFRGVAIAPGRHEVVFRYAPGSLRLGGGLSVLGLLAILGLVARRLP